ncbi:MAG: hypothetical protein K8T91_25520 [Planctomycetes bacterium]|nr:hypothetical protein [Planctomycetota bacterium]
MKALLVGLVGVFAACVFLIPSVDAQIPGGRKKVPVDDQGVVEAAKFAVQAHAKAAKDEDLTLVKILDAQRQVVQGYMYTITLDVKSGSRTKKAVAEVWVKPLLKDEKEEDRIQLNSWKWK